MPRRASRSTPRQECFPFAGCVSYRGFFSEEEARRHAARLREEGNDVYLGGVPAYSTLGWFDDPLLSTFIRYPDVQLARLMFHELAHQRVYVKGDTTFNESFAVAVEEEGVRRWLEAEGRGGELEALRAARLRRQEFAARVAQTRERLSQVYQEKTTEEEKLKRKTEEWEKLRRDYPNAVPAEPEQCLPGLDRAVHPAGAGIRAPARRLRRRPEGVLLARRGAGGAQRRARGAHESGMSTFFLNAGRSRRRSNQASQVRQRRPLDRHPHVALHLAADAGCRPW